MSALAVSHLYRYAAPSELAAQAGGSRLRLATCGGVEEAPRFFRGKLLYPRRTADLLRGLVAIVQSRFYTPPAMLARILALADPVVTSNETVLRFEAFSACCSTYARVDLLGSSFDGEQLGRGTTNVDFNAPLRAALARIREADSVAFAVGLDAFELSRGGKSLIERKVALPVRWLKGFVEVQAYQARMSRRWEVSGLQAQRFLRALPRSTGTATGWVAPAGRGLRLSQTAGKDSVRLDGVQRLRVLEPLVRHSQALRVYQDQSSDASTWELVLGEARFHLVLSPQVSRGFSGEGQVLAELAGSRWQETLPRVRASLQWENTINSDHLAVRLALSKENVTAALSVLGSRGLVGYDLAEERFFHRELPFDLSQIDALQPRLRDARQLVAEGGVRIEWQEGERVEAYVRGTGVEHRVRLNAEEARCSCPWYAKHEGERGPCKHVLAVQLVLEADGLNQT
jgi:hypothetical protein